MTKSERIGELLFQQITSQEKPPRSLDKEPQELKKAIREYLEEMLDVKYDDLPD